MLHVIVPLVGAFRRRYPLIQLELNTDDLVIDLLEQQTDVAIRMGDLPDSSIRARQLGKSRLRLLASPDYLAAHGRPESAAALAQHTLLGFSHLDRHNLWPIGQQDGSLLQIVPALSASSGETLRQLAIGGQGIVRLSDFLTHDDVRAGRLVPILTDETRALFQPIHAVYYRNSTLSARITCFLDFLSEQLADKPWLEPR